MRALPTHPDSDCWDPDLDIEGTELARQEAKWWYLRPGEEGYDQPLYAYLGLTEAQWREYATGQRREAARRVSRW